MQIFNPQLVLTLVLTLTTTLDEKYAFKYEKTVINWSAVEVANWAREVLNFANLPPNEQLTVQKTLDYIVAEEMDGDILLMLENMPDMMDCWRVVDEDLAQKLWSEIQLLRIKNYSQENELRTARIQVESEFLREDWLNSLNNNDALNHKIYHWLQKHFKFAAGKEGNSSANDPTRVKYDPRREKFAEIQREMMLTQRDEAFSQIELFVDSRIRDYQKSDIFHHKFLMLLGGCGIGKTRMAREVEKIARIRTPNKASTKQLLI